MVLWGVLAYFTDEDLRDLADVLYVFVVVLLGVDEGTLYLHAEFTDLVVISFCDFLSQEANSLEVADSDLLLNLFSFIEHNDSERLDV